jgi:outer membrane protein OmpA-like peptidoglycan-associated protein
LPKYNRDRVQEIGRFLGERKEDWNSLIVSGHTDEQGKKSYNIKLSKARADTVRQ